jgi:transposase
VIWLLRRLSPDFKTIADFRRDNRAAFRRVFREFNLLCRELDLFGRDLIAVDGSRIKAVNSLERNFTKARMARELARSDERLERYLKGLDEADKDSEGGPGGGHVDRLQEKIASIRDRRARLAQTRKTLEASGEDQLSLTDPDARAMRSGTGVGVGYNIQIAVDTRHKLIAEAEVHSKVSDLGLLAKTAEAARDMLGVDRIEVVADRGYFKIEDIEACETAGITPFVPKPVRGSTAASGLFTKNRFRYDADANAYTCLGGAVLRQTNRGRSRNGLPLDIYTNAEACGGCALRTRCTTGAMRRVTRFANEAVLDRMADRLVARPEVLDQRRESVEHPFGSIKQWMDQGAFLMRRLDNVRDEFSLTALAYNLRRAINLVGIPALIAAVRG